MIGDRVLERSAVLGFARRDAIYLPSARFDQVHAAVCGLERGWPVVTGEPGACAGIEELDVEALP